MHTKTITSIIILIVVALGLYLAANYFKKMPQKNEEQSIPNLLQITVLREGRGQEVKDGDQVSVNYTGTLENGTVFDSNVDPKFGHVTPFQFIVGGHQVIEGWDKGVLGMKVGEVRRLVISPSLAYGANAVGPIPANSTLIFEVELLAIKK